MGGAAAAAAASSSAAMAVAAVAVRRHAQCGHAGGRAAEPARAIAGIPSPWLQAPAVDRTRAGPFYPPALSSVLVMMEMSWQGGEGRGARGRGGPASLQRSGAQRGARASQPAGRLRPGWDPVATAAPLLPSRQPPAAAPLTRFISTVASTNTNRMPSREAATARGGGGRGRQQGFEARHAAWPELAGAPQGHAAWPAIAMQRQAAVDPARAMSHHPPGLWASSYSGFRSALPAHQVTTAWGWGRAGGRGEQAEGARQVTPWVGVGGSAATTPAAAPRAPVLRPPCAPTDCSSPQRAATDSLVTKTPEPQNNNSNKQMNDSLVTKDLPMVEKLSCCSWSRRYMMWKLVAKPTLRGGEGHQGMWGSCAVKRGGA